MYQILKKCNEGGFRINRITVLRSVPKTTQNDQHIHYRPSPPPPCLVWPGEDCKGSSRDQTLQWVNINPDGV